AVANAFTGAIGAAAYVAPVAFVVVGALMVARSELVDVRPFRTGLLVTSFGLLTVLGAENGGPVGPGPAKPVGLLVGTTGATIIGQFAGPRVTRYELQLAPGTKVSKVAALKDDLSYALATTEIRILAPIPGKQAVGVELPNLSPNLVTLGDIFDDLPATASP